MHHRTIQRLVVLAAILTLAACSRAAAPLPDAGAARAADMPTAAPATRTPARPTATPARPNATPVATTAPTAVPPTLAAPTVAPATAVVANGGNVREVPVRGTPRDQVNARESVQLIGKNENGTWYLLITARKITGWVSATLLTIDPAVAAQVPIVPATAAPAPAATAAPAPAATAAPAPAAQPDGWMTHVFGAHTIALPPSWRPIPLTKDDLERTARELDAENPALAQLVRGLIASGQSIPIQFFAIDATTGANVNVLSVARPSGTTADALLEQAIAAVPQLLPNSTLISSDSKGQVDGLRAGRVVYDLTLTGADGRATTMRGVQWYIVTADRLFAITVTGSVGDALISVADRIGQSFRAHNTASAAASGTPRQVVHGGNLRQTPQVTPANVIGQVCPGDQVTLRDEPATGGWVAVRIAVTGPDCDPKRVPAGAEGWVSATLLG